MDINDKLQFWNKEIERAREYDFYFDPGSVAEIVKECEKQQQEIQGLEEQAGEMAEKHAEKDIIMGNMQQEIERLEQQIKRFEYLASYEYSFQIDNAKNSRSQFHKGALEAMENYNRKWKEATEREIKALW